MTYDLAVCVCQMILDATTLGSAGRSVASLDGKVSFNKFALVLQASSAGGSAGGSVGAVSAPAWTKLCKVLAPKVLINIIQSWNFIFYSCI